MTIEGQFSMGIRAALPARADFLAFHFRPFDDALVKAMVDNLPALAAYHPMPHPDAPASRFAIPLNESQSPSPFWREIGRTLRSDRIRDDFAFALGLPGELMHPAVALIRDLPGYCIGIHPDTRRKLATAQVYLARDDSAPHLGVRFHRMVGGEFEETGGAPYMPGSGYFFRRSETSWHSVNRTWGEDGVRDSLMLIYFDAPKEGFL